MNLPSRAQMVSMAERLASIEGQLNEIKALLQQVHGHTTAPNAAATPRPPRTKRPPSPPAGGGEQK
jgi:alkanesulfonate monooxygenase SsuD/methylene tetrahydromethanopterin reductase-like flavin-dependent oxidoreductase (luciferase family)